MPKLDEATILADIKARVAESDDYSEGLTAKMEARYADADLRQSYLLS